ncbi:MAG: hypothetical protein ACOZAG_02950 [Patescibacteria group bacterium]
MVKKIFFSLILIGGLVFLGSGCAPQEPEVNINEDTNVIVNEAVGEENVNAINPGVTAEELDELKSKINEMDYEDLNGFNN